MRKPTLFLIIFLFLIPGLVSFGKDLTPTTLIQIHIANPSDLKKYAELPLTLNYRCDTFILATVAQKDLEKLTSAGCPFTVLEQSAWEQPYYILAKPHQKKLEGSPQNIKPLLQTEQELVVKLSPEEKNKVLQQGFQIARISNKPLPWTVSEVKSIKSLAVTQGQNPVIAALVKRISNASLKAGLLRLQDFQTRYSGSDSIVTSSQWIFDQFKSYGYSDVVFDTLTILVDGRIQRNVIAIKKGTVYPDSIIVFGGHYDSVVYDGADPYTWAPGVDDNGTGTVAVLEAARILAGIDLKTTVMFACWAAEEQGLYGSTDWVDRAFQQKLNIGLYINFDMIANVDWNDPIRDVVVYSNGASQGYADLMQEMAQTYTQLLPRIAGAGGGSDHYPFMQYGYHIVYAEEGDFSPNWHKRTDTIDNVDIDYFNEVVRMGMATLLQVAGAPDSFQETYVTYSAFNINDSGSGQSIGNNNGYLDSGETIELYLTFKNIGEISAHGGTATLETTNPNVTILHNTLPYAKIAAGDTLLLASPFIFSLAQNIPDKETIVFTVQIQDSLNQIWENFLLLQIVQPALSYTKFSIKETAGDNDRAADPGEICNLFLMLTNSGSRPAQDIVATLTCLDPDINITDATAAFNPIAQNASESNFNDPFTFIVQPNSEPHLAEFQLDISEGQNFYTKKCFFNILLGQPPLLLVSDDGEGQKQQAFFESFQQIGIAADIWDNSIRGIPLADTLSRYSTIIWYTGAEGKNSLTADEQTVLKSYLDQGGHLLLSGDFIGYYLRRSTFYSDYLHAAFIGAQTKIYQLNGVEGNPVTDIDYMSIDPSSKCWPTEIDPIAPALPVLHYDRTAQGSGEIVSSGTAALAVENASYRIVYCSFMVEGLVEPARAKFLKDVLQWFNGAPIDMRAVLTLQNFSADDDSSGDGDGFLNPGESIRLSLTIKNEGPLPAENIHISLHSDDDMVQILDSTATIDAIASNSSVLLEHAYVIAIDSRAENDHQVKCSISMIDDQGHRWQDAFQFTIVISATIAGNVTSAVTGQGVMAHILWSNAQQIYSDIPIISDLWTDQNGSYQLSLPMGSYDIAAIAEGTIMTEPVTVNVPPDTLLNLVVTSPELSVSPDSLSVTADAAVQVSDSVIIANNGTGDLYVSLYEFPRPMAERLVLPAQIYKGGDQLSLRTTIQHNSARSASVMLPPDSTAWKLVYPGKKEMTLSFDLQELYVQNNKTDIYLKQNTSGKEDFKFNFTNYVFLDTDYKQTTGMSMNGCGIDYAIYVSLQESYIFRWNATINNFEVDLSNPTPQYISMDPDKHCIEVGLKLQQFGNPERIKIINAILDFNGIILDIEPSYGLYYIPYSTVNTAWLDEDGFCRIISAGHQEKIGLTFNAQKLTGGDYHTYLIFESNQAGNVMQSVPIQFTVKSTSVQQQSEAIPEHYALQQNYPNPFSLGRMQQSFTMIKFQLPKNNYVTITVYNLLGQEVATLLAQNIKAGYHQILWDGSLNDGHIISSGIYFYRLQAGDFVQTKKMLIVW